MVSMKSERNVVVVNIVGLLVLSKLENWMSVFDQCESEEFSPL